jgi:hypothetical protein
MIEKKMDEIKLLSKFLNIDIMKMFILMVQKKIEGNT